MATLILGSKQNPSIPLNFKGTVLFVNGSIKNLDTHSFESCEKWHLFANIIFTPVNDAVVLARKQFKDRKVDFAVCMDSFASIQPDYDFFKEVGYEYKEIKFVSREEKEKQSIKALDLISFFDFLFAKAALSEKKKLGQIFIKQKEIRISTGVYGLLYAMRQNMPAPYILSGIGITNSGYSYSDSKQHKRGHILNDSIFLKAIIRSKEGKEIYTTEKELQEEFSIKLI